MNKRGSGILLHITSLPSPFGIGDLGPWAYRFADFLSQTKQRYWQILPLTPTDLISGNSPYNSISASAGNTLLISPDMMVASGFLTKEDIAAPPGFPDGRCDYAAVIPYKMRLFHLAYERFKMNKHERNPYEEFCSLQKEWLEDFALFVVIKNHCNRQAWSEWTKGLRDRSPEDLAKIKNDCYDEIEREKFLQYLFFKQWFSLKQYCNERGIKFIGDIPIYVNFDSADVWTHTKIFKLDKVKKPLSVAGVPPDYFSNTGQLWGNPIYRWDVLKATGFKWWFQRIAHNLQIVDVLRIDHFRGFVAFWEVPSTEKTAVNGTWVKAPAVDFFTTLLKKFPVDSFIAEDLGVITSDVREIMNRFGFQGMRILLFAFGEDLPTHPYLPHNYVLNCIVYTGTHDNNTARGWFDNETSPQDRQRLFRYLGNEVSGEQVPKKLIRLAMMSVANTVITPMQDILSLGEEARMNRPSVTDGNWEWRLLSDQLSPASVSWLREITEMYAR
ncbi:MAG: 4-alpha-glucanotransferase [Nitrospirota bacterium]